jgi:dihydropyrimidinase
MEFDLVVANGTVVTADAAFRADVGVSGGKIAAVAQSPIPNLQSPSRLDAAGCYVLPGAVDGHVHLHMSTGAGYTADDWRAGTEAAALGGTTSLVDFVETRPGEPLLDALASRIDDAADAVIDYGLHMTVQPDEQIVDGIPRRVSDARIAQIGAAAQAGCATFKLYMAYPGFQVRDGDLFRALRAVAGAGGLACLHAENGEVIEELRRTAGKPGPPVSSALWHARTRPPANEGEAAARAVMCAELSGARILIFHIGCQAAARVVADARLRGPERVFGETCPHYLALTEDQLAREDGRLWVCAPPLRPQADQDALWGLLASGALDVVGTDHCPFTRAQKDAGRNDFRRVPGGVPGIETRLGLLHELGVRRGRLALTNWARVCCTRPAELYGLQSKGRIAPGYDADLVVFDPDRAFELTADHLHSRIDWSAYEGLTGRGWARDVVSRGEVIVRDGQFTGAARRGQFLRRGY